MNFRIDVKKNTPIYFNYITRILIILFQNSKNNSLTISSNQIDIFTQKLTFCIIEFGYQNLNKLIRQK